MASSSSSSSGALLLPQPAEAVLLAFIVVVALAELSRAALAPLPDLGECVTTKKRLLCYAAAIA